MTPESTRYIAVDPKGNLIVPIGSTETVNVYQGPNMCGTGTRSLSDPYGQPSDVATMNALTGTIVVGNIVGSRSYGGNIAICTLKGGSKGSRHNPTSSDTLAAWPWPRTGDCWATSNRFASHVPRLPADDDLLGKGCTGSGEAVTGYQNKAYGSISIDGTAIWFHFDQEGFERRPQLWTLGVQGDAAPTGSSSAARSPLRGHEVFKALNEKILLIRRDELSRRSPTLNHVGPASTLRALRRSHTSLAFKTAKRALTQKALLSALLGSSCPPAISGRTW